MTTTRGEPLYDAVKALSRDGVKINMTAIFTPDQVARAVDALAAGLTLDVPASRAAE